MTEQNERKVWEFSKKMTFLILMMLMLHLAAHLVTSMLMLGDYKLIKESLVSSFPYYISSFGLFLGKTTFENFDIHKNRMRERQLDCMVESNG